MSPDAIEQDGVVIVRLHADIDFAAADALGHELFRAVPDEAIGLVLDLAEVRYIDSGGVRMLFELASRLDTARRKLALAVPETSPLRRLIKITRLEEVAVLCASSDECAELVRTA